MTDTGGASNPFETDLDRTAANHRPLTPLQFLDRTALMFPDRTSVIHGATRFTWAESHERCRRLASALRRRGIGPGDTVAVMAPNIPALFEAHYGVPMAGAVLNALNTRLDPATIAFILEHGEARLLIADREFSAVVGAALAAMERPPEVIDIDDPAAAGGAPIGDMDYEALLGTGDPGDPWSPPSDEWQAIALNYTSGTTGNPKGVVYHHRGAYLERARQRHGVGDGQPPGLSLDPADVSLQRLVLSLDDHRARRHPRLPAPGRGRRDLRRDCGPRRHAPLRRADRHVMNLLVNADDQEKDRSAGGRDDDRGRRRRPPAVLEAMDAMGIAVTHVYGLTEVYGPAVVCAWHDELGRPAAGRSRPLLKARQGVRYPVLEGLMVADADTLEPVPADGATPSARSSSCAAISS